MKTIKKVEYQVAFDSGDAEIADHRIIAYKDKQTAIRNAKRYNKHPDTWHGVPIKVKVTKVTTTIEKEVIKL